MKPIQCTSITPINYGFIRLAFMKDGILTVRLNEELTLQVGADFAQAEFDKLAQLDTIFTNIHGVLVNKEEAEIAFVDSDGVTLIYRNSSVLEVVKLK